MDQLEEMAAEFTTEELREFLEGDLLDSEADPDFKESLRRRLWEMLKAGLVENSGND